MRYAIENRSTFLDPIRPNEKFGPRPTFLTIALGKNWNQNLTPENHNPRELMSAESYMTAIAAAHIARLKSIKGLRRFGQRMNFILLNSGGITRDGFPAESHAMSYAQKEQFPTLERNNLYIADEDNSIDTPSNMLEIANFIKGLQRTGSVIMGTDLVTVGFHLERAKMVAERYGIRTNQSYASEKVIQEEFTKDDFFVSDYNQGDWMRRQKALEFALRTALRLDPFDGRIFPRMATRRIRK